ncbi:MAG: hypothetical protein M3474_00150 [Actinomycetota bacterium]|nr:hypothetical protein [Actinomycetota bacterium]
MDRRMLGVHAPDAVDRADLHVGDELGEALGSADEHRGGRSHEGSCAGPQQVCLGMVSRCQVNSHVLLFSLRGKQPQVLLPGLLSAIDNVRGRTVSAQDDVRRDAG